jgi:imidazolonepropionase-like amidohydrolase
VDQAKAAGARSVKIILESGSAGNLFNRLDTNIAKAIADQARKHSLAVAVHTGDARDVADAIAFGASSIEHGSVREPIPDSLFAAMAKQGIAYDPTLTVIEALSDLKLGRTTLLDRTLVQQVAPEGLIKATKAALSKITPATEPPNALAIAEDNLRRAFKSGVTLVTGSDAGNMLVIHGPTVHREMQLWVKAGIPAETAIRAATQNTATLLGIGHRAGRIQPGYDATMLLIDGNPLEEIAATERISGGGVFFKGERIDRAALFEKE